jgi:hypothetical protein
MTAGFEKATIRHNIVRTFKAAGTRIRFPESHNALVATVNREAVKKVSH